jgi:DNA polymerase I-like protein with 3'-5' exonuclease and polymerase domains
VDEGALRVARASERYSYKPKSENKTYYNVGGSQLPMFHPETTWIAPTELPDLRRVKRVALDRECKDDGLAQSKGPGWAVGAGYVCGSSYAWREGEALRSIYVPLRHPDGVNFDPEQLARWERDLDAAGVEFVMQNAPYDVGWGFADLKVPCPKKVHDTTCMAYMIDESRLSYQLDHLCRWRGLPGKDEDLLREAAAVYGWKSDEVKARIHQLPARYVGQYGETDAVRTLQLAESLEPELHEQEVWQAYQLEMDLLPVVHEMRRRGIRVNVERAVEVQKMFFAKAEAAFQELRDKLSVTAVGIDELRSNDWMDRVFTAHKVRVPRDHQNRGSFDKRWMQYYDHWLPRLCVRAKAYYEAADKFVGNYILGYASNSRLHASVNQFKSEDGYGTKTYRFSYSDPPLQQMPSRDDLASTEIRGLFEAEPGERWGKNDYSQQEYRLIVSYAVLNGLDRAEEAAQQYIDDPKTDFHSMVAEMTGLDRKPAKDTNFAKSYGAGIPKFAAMINKSHAEAEAIMRQYDEKLPFNAQLFQKCQKLAEKRGYMVLLDKARIHYEDWEPTWLSKEERSAGYAPGSPYRMNPCGLEEARARLQIEGHPWHHKRLRRANCRKAMNALIQGSAARQTKMAMREIYRAGLVPLLQMHDELNFSFQRKSDAETVVTIMRDVVKIKVPMLVDAGYGPSWGTAKSSWREAKTAK